MLSLVNSSEDRLAEFFCTYPDDEFTVAEIAERVDLSEPWISEKIDVLSEKGFLKVSRRGNLKLASFESDKEENLRFKQVLNLEKLRESDLLEDIVGEYSYPEAVILFGSFAKGEDDAESDIDIAVISSADGEVDAEVMDREVSITRFDPVEVPENMLETLANGVVLYGYLDIGVDG